MQERATIVEGEIDVEQVARNYERSICEALNQMEVAEVRQLVLEIEDELDKSGSSASPMRRQAAEVLTSSRAGPERASTDRARIALARREGPEPKGPSPRVVDR